MNTGMVVPGRVKRDATLEQVAQELAPRLSSWAEDELAPVSGAPSSSRVHIERLQQGIVARVEDRILLPFLATALVQLLACVNVANLLLSRLPSRRPELAVRRALGAIRLRLVAQLLAEAGTLALAAALLGAGLAAAAVRLVTAFGPVEQIRRLDEVAVNGVALLFCIAVAASCTLVCGLLPAWRGGRISERADLAKTSCA